jgi:hypothetical protein
LSTNIFCLSARNREKRRRKGLGSKQPILSSVWHTGQCPVRQAGFRRTGHSRECLAAYGYNSPDCPVSQRPPAQRSAVQSAGDAWPVPTVGRGHRTGPCQLPRRCNGHLRQIRKEIRTGHATVTVRWCTGLSGAPHDRRKLWPSLLASNDS